MKKSLATIASALLALGCGMLAGCAGGGASSSDGSNATAGSNGSSVTVFGTIDASVTGIRSQSQSR